MWALCCGKWEFCRVFLRITPLYVQIGVEEASYARNLANFATKVANFDGKTPDIDSKVANIDGEVANIDGKVANIDDKKTFSVNNVGSFATTETEKQRRMNFQNTTAAVIGLARAGAPAARFLLQRGARVIGYDSKARADLSDEALQLERDGVTVYTGEHDFAGIEAADLIVLSPGLKVHYEPLQSVIANAEARGAEVIGELELASRFCPCPMIGVTGTKGKSTTVKLITEMLRACGVDAHSAGNTGTPLIEMLGQLTPESWAVVEVSSFQLEKAPTFKPKIAVLLSLLEDHQDYHPTLEQYWETKNKIFISQTKEDYAIFNLDDGRVETVAFTNGHPFDLQSQFVYTSGETNIEEKDSENLNVFRRDDLVGVSFPEGSNFKLVIAVEDVPLQGAHNISNLSAAIGVTHVALGGDRFAANKNQIADAIRDFQTLPHRLEVVARKGGVTYVNDSQSTIPDASIAALRSFPKPVTLLLGGKAKIEADSYRALMDAVRQAGAKIGLFGEAAAMLEEVARAQGVKEVQIKRADTLAEVLQNAKIEASLGETIVLSPACASFDQFKSYEDRGQTFRALVANLSD